MESSPAESDGQSAQAPNLSLDEAAVPTPTVPDLDAVTPTARPIHWPAESQPMSLDLGEDAYAQELAQTGYGNAAPTPMPPTPAGYPQPGQVPPAGYPSTPSAQPGRYAEPGPYAEPYEQPAQYPPVVEYAPASDRLTPDQERTWASAAHWSALAASLVGLGFLGPLLVYLIQGPKSAWVKAQAAESLNFEITYAIGMVASLIALTFMVGFITAPIFAVIWLVLRILATVATAKGRDYRYPVNIRMVK